MKAISRKMRHLSDLREVRGPVALAIGVFDGVHRGHQEVIRAAVEHANQHAGTAVVMTFDPHPKELLAPDRAPLRLTPVDHQEILFQRMGLENLLVCRFDAALAATSADAFVSQLVEACQPLGCISVGYTWSFGCQRSGDVHFLMDAGQRLDFAVYGVPPVKREGRVVSSTWVREAVAGGRLAEAEALLGRPFSLMGEVVEGRQLGRQIGFPTANVETDGLSLPLAGVYAVEVQIGEEWRPGVANVGRKPTVADAGALSLEAHLFDWQGELYGQRVEVRFRNYLRPEQRFDGVEALKAQIGRDALAARAALAR